MTDRRLTPRQRAGRDGEAGDFPHREPNDPRALRARGEKIVADIRRLAAAFDEAFQAQARPGEGMGSIKSTIERAADDLAGSVRVYVPLLTTLRER